jgi:hypothetical protein
MVVVHEICPMPAIAPTLAADFGEVAAWAGAHHVPIARAIARYERFDAGVCELDAGFVVDALPADAPDGERVHACELGGCEVAYATHLGAYDSLAETYADIERWMRTNGFVSAGPIWEEYFSPPGTPPEQTRTDVYWPIARA